MNEIHAETVFRQLAEKGIRLFAHAREIQMLLGKDEDRHARAENVRTRHAAGLSLAEIARRDRLPEDYVAAVLAESADTESDVVMDSECE